MTVGGMLRQGVGGVGGYSAKVLSHSPLAYWPLWEPSGGVAYDISGNGHDGAYTGVTLGEEGIGDGRTCPFFDGANDYVNIWSAGFRDAFNGQEGSLLAWIKVFNAGVWTDVSTRRTLTLRADTSNQMFCFSRSTADNALLTYYRGGGTVLQRSKASLTELGWMCVGMTWSLSADEMIPYYQGAPEGSALTGLGTWVGNLLSTRTCIGAAITTPGSVWHGWIAHCAVWAGTILSPAAMASLAQV